MLDTPPGFIYHEGRFAQRSVYLRGEAEEGFFGSGQHRKLIHI
jgi:hypothetical protein